MEPQPTAPVSDNQSEFLRSFEPKKSVSWRSSFRSAWLIVGIIVAGIASGWGIAKVSGSPLAGAIKSPDLATQEGIVVGDVVGVADEKSFRDTTEGTLETGGIEGEGSHHLTRPGGDSQTVYLTSTIVDLDLFVGRKVKVWGETFSAQKAGWLMDVGRVQVLQ